MTSEPLVESPPTTGALECHIVHSRLETLNLADLRDLIDDIQLILIDMEAAAIRQDAPLSAIIAENQAFGVGVEWHEWHPLRVPSAEYEVAENLVGSLTVKRVRYASPFELILTAPDTWQTTSFVLGLAALPKLIRSFSRLRVYFAQDRHDKALWEARTEQLRHSQELTADQRALLESILQVISKEHLSALTAMDRVITTNGDKVIDSDHLEDDEDPAKD